VRKVIPLKRRAAPLQSKKVATGTTKSQVSLSRTAKQEYSIAKAPLRPQEITQRRPLQSNAGSSKIGGSNALGTKKRPLNTQKSTARSSSQLSSPIAAASSVLAQITLPTSIRRVLRPHQVTGVDFLWKALTSTHHGAILADEMGLGKTLMSIAVICGLHRRDRGKVSSV